MRKAFIILGIIAGLALAAVATDRIALIVWRYRVNHYFAQLEHSADLLSSAKARHAEGSLISWSGERNSWQVPLLEITACGPQPDEITVDGNGGLNLVYLPPLLAWSRHVPWAFNQHPIQGSDIYPENDLYTIQIFTLEGRPGGKELPSPTVGIEHGLPF